MLWLILLIIVAGYLLAAIFLAIFQERFVFVPGKTVFITPAEKGMDFEEFWLDLPDGNRINGWFIKADSPKATLLFCHGNAGTISHRLDSAEIFLDLGLHRNY